MGMTKVGARQVIDALAMRIFEIEEVESRLSIEKQQLRERIHELEWFEDGDQVSIEDGGGL
jgi:hypothetical protein